MKTSFRLNGKTVAWDLDPARPCATRCAPRASSRCATAATARAPAASAPSFSTASSVNSCQILAVQADGRDVRTVDGLSKDRELSIVQRALVDAACVQCGYCTPAVTLAIHELLERSKPEPQPSRRGHSRRAPGTLCRCTGYEQFYNAVRIASKRLSEPGYGEAAAPEFGPTSSTSARIARKSTRPVWP